MRTSLILLGLTALAQVAFTLPATESYSENKPQASQISRVPSYAGSTAPIADVDSLTSTGTPKEDKKSSMIYRTPGEQASTPKKKDGPIYLGYFSDWTSVPGGYTPDKLPLDKLTHINYAFALIDNKTFVPYLLPSKEVDSEEVLHDVVKRASAKGVNVAISIGGWTGSAEFQSMVESPENRKKFIAGTVDFVKKFNLDGVDLDWEHPGKPGASCNPAPKPTDVPNYLTLIDELRAALNAEGSKKYYISVAASVTVWMEGDQPSKNIAKFNNLDFISIMAYDVNGLWSNMTAVNAPLNPGTKADNVTSFTTAIDNWIKAGISPEKLVMGVPFYGRSLQVQGKKPATSLYSPIEPLIPPSPKETNKKPQPDPCNPTATPQYEGVWTYSEIRKIALSDSGVAAKGWTRYVDDATKTPWLMRQSDGLFITYDDATSLAAKASYAKSKNIAGLMIWSMDGDSEDGELMNALIQPGSGSGYDQASNSSSRMVLPGHSTIPINTSTDPTPKQ